MTRPNDAIPIAQVARPHGVRGELRLKLFNDKSTVLLGLDEVLVRLPDGTEHQVSVDHARPAGNAILLKLHDVDDRDRADQLRGAQICVPRHVLPPPEEGEFYVCDVVGAEVLVDGNPFGTVIEHRSYPTADALVVRDGAGVMWEIPLVEAFIAEIDTQAGRVVLRTIEGLERL